MLMILIICLLIIFAVIAVTVFTTSKAYQFKHTIDPAPPEEKKKEK
ncbi:MAG: YtzI protein [Bacillus sp. (in: firmicutes)]